MNKVNVTTSFNKDDKIQMDKMLKELGITFSAALNMFVKQSIRENRLPLSLDLNVDTQRVLRDVQNNIDLSKPYDNIKDFWKDMLSDDW